MKTFHLFVSATLLFWGMACIPKPTVFTGTVVDATMNAVVVRDDTGNTATFTTGDAKKTVPLRIGQTITVEYEGELDETVGRALKITAAAPQK